MQSNLVIEYRGPVDSTAALYLGDPTFKLTRDWSPD